MALPLSGEISMSQVAVELGLPGTTALDLNDSRVRNLAGKPSGVIAMSDLHGKSARPWHSMNITVGTAAGTTFYGFNGEALSFFSKSLFGACSNKVTTYGNISVFFGIFKLLELLGLRIETQWVVVVRLVVLDSSWKLTKAELHTRA